MSVANVSRAIIAGWVILGGIIVYLLVNHLPIVKEKIVEVTVEKVIEIPATDTSVLVSITKEDIASNLVTNYPHISESNRVVILETVFSVSDRYAISPLVLYSIIAVESSFRWWLEHDLATVQSTETNKPVKTRAIGLGGIIFEIWGKELKEANIIATKSDLFNIVNNINAIGYIYSKLKAMPLHAKANNAIESGLIRYFGGGYVSYFEKIDREVVKLIKEKVYR